MSQKDRFESWEDYIITALAKCAIVRVPEVTMFTYIGLKKEEAESLASRNNLALTFLEHRVNDFPGVFEFRKKKKEKEK